jgi:hypothetical protein
MQAYFVRALELLQHVSDLRDPSMFVEGYHHLAVKAAGGWNMLRKVRPRQVTTEARNSFAEAFGTSLVEQRRLEEILPAQIDFGMGPWETFHVYDVPEPEILPTVDANYWSTRG